jgi:hypothetical protein
VRGAYWSAGDSSLKPDSCTSFWRARAAVKAPIELEAGSGSPAHTWLATRQH